MKRELRRRCEERLNSIELPEPFDVRVFCNQVAMKRGRPIVLCPLSTDGAPYGAWLSTSSTDYIFYEEHTSGWHRDHIILHEVCHILCGHRGILLSQPDALGLLFPDLAPESVRSMLLRKAYREEEDQEAEVLASLILQRTSTGRARELQMHDPARESLQHQIDRSLGPASDTN